MMNTEQARFNMIEQQIRPWDVLDRRVLDLLARVRREAFVPEAHRSLAFVDTQVPLLPGAPDGTCMLEPRLEARMLQELALDPGERVLEIGAGSGFMAALLAGLAGEVTTLDIREDMAALARRNLDSAGLHAVKVLRQDGSAGLAAQGPFDAIVLSGSVAEVPPALLSQLRPGGRLIAIVGDLPVMRARLFRRGEGAAWSHTDLFDTMAPRLLNFPEPSRFRF
jgi:protein-L-isoaspartate(D-aspartate) O-methyltransferase